LRTSQKIPVLFAIADRIWGPLEDVTQLLTYNSTQPAHAKRHPVQSFALLVQISRVGRVAKWYEEKYAQLRWDNERAYLRRVLTVEEGWRLRRALYRLWLYSVAFHGPEVTRMGRMVPEAVRDRCALLRTWSNEELSEIEDCRATLETLVGEICPTDGDVYWRRGGPAYDKYGSGHHQHHLLQGAARLKLASSRDEFYDSRSAAALLDDNAIDSDVDLDRERFGTHAKNDYTAAELRERLMDGWGDDVEQYHILSDIMKLNPLLLMRLYEGALTKRDVLAFIEEWACRGVSVGLQDHAEPEGHVLMGNGASWFWNNGETLLHTWILVMHGRGLPVQEIREKIYCGLAGVAVDEVQ
jgi:hypothetical protein